MTNMTGSKLSIFSHPVKITGYWITTRSFPYQDPYWPILSRANMGLFGILIFCLKVDCENKPEKNILLH
jgi:hypothetical protein